MKTKLTIEFDSQSCLEHFASWLCNSGEAQYWEWMEYREQEESGNITATQFHYHGIEDQTKEITDASRYGEFISDNTIRTTCGRLDKR